jgi:hypothetical protein
MQTQPTIQRLRLDPSELYRAADHCPRLDTIGLFFASTVPHEEFGGIFCWFESFGGLKSFVATGMLRPHHDAAIPGMYESLLERTSADLLRALSLAESADALTPGALAQLNSLMPHREIRWTGTFQDLAAGNSAFAREVRLAFACQSDDAGSADCDPFGSLPATVAPLPSAQLEAFLEFIRDYGSA